MSQFIGIIGLLLIFGLAVLISSDRKAIKRKPLIIMLVLQFAFGFVLLRTTFGTAVVAMLAKLFDHLLAFAGEGVNFVFGGVANVGSAPFFLNVLMPIVFISAIIGILRYIKILPLFMKAVGLGLSKINGMGKLESYNGVASAILGQSEVFISIKKELPFLTEKRLFSMSVSAMSTVSMSIVGSYMALIDSKYVITALVLNLFGGYILASIVNPYELDEKEDELVIEEDKEQTFFQMLGEYILDGFHVAITVAAMLIGFVALIAMINALFNGIFGITFQQILGYIFAPFAFISGIPWKEAVDAGSIMATKLVTNEFVAMTELSTGTFEFTERTTAILSVFLVSFANFSSIGIISGAMKGLNEEKGNLVAKHGLKILFTASLVSFLSAIVTGILV
ncbi:MULTISPECIES: NupC/NupG family nucleoside CNT transporter [Enterococcus]|uniref:NupC family Na dependent nucleoside transporter n=1 Tax=Enterococcus mundtii TaxID=53346 RepID=A0A1A6GB45_ENTMU|nr:MULTISPECIES: nucleoside transporter C-terminal domain-containing protein [Enterococcus]MBO1085321.1 NupC/NupG family nucleoside CNT transporter [Enterococcus mundtii]MDB7087340.1 nucleoside transporter C-terminal domain-containing protein [Enterococcus mundtii]MDB7101520.1 nucleoside transporter C-terminal domain-containing protein [Enterococcus mundtii]MDV7744664.1 nucleoside transporter C-terminal domain-containing protein [Enterococcus mundtii]NBA61047.1 NupC/NupG family nucleoside CNT 